MIKKYSISIFVIFITITTNAQIFKLDSILIKQIRTYKLPDILQKNHNNGRLPVFISNDLKNLFLLKDTIIDGLNINYFSHKREMITKYKLEKSNDTMSQMSVVLNDVTDTSIIIGVGIGYFICGKGLFNENSLLAVHDGNPFILIEYFYSGTNKESIIIRTP